MLSVSGPHKSLSFVKFISIEVFFFILASKGSMISLADASRSSAPFSFKRRRAVPVITFVMDPQTNLSVGFALIGRDAAARVN